MRAAVFAATLLAASAAGAQDENFQPPSPETTEHMQTRIETVYLRMKLTDDQLVDRMRAYYGRDIRIEARNDGTRDVVHVIARPHGIIYYNIIATLPAP